jgi:hypothetical protein
MVAPSNKRFLLESDKAVANGLATLDGGSKIPAAQVPTRRVLGAAPALWADKYVPVGVDPATTDVSSYVQQVIDEAAATGAESTIHWPAGTMIAEIVIPSNVHIKGSSHGRSVIQAVPGSTRKGIVTMSQAGGPITRFTIEDLSINGNSGNTNQWGIYAKTPPRLVSPFDSGIWYSAFRNVKVTNTLGGGIWLIGGGDDSLGPMQFINFDNVSVQVTAGTAPNWDGILLSGQVGQVVFNQVESSYRGTGFGHRALWIARQMDEAKVNVSDKYGYAISFNACTFQGAAVGIQIDRAQGIAFNGCWIEDNQSGFLIGQNAKGITFTSCVFADSGSNGSGTGYVGKVTDTASVVLNAPIIIGAVETLWSQDAASTGNLDVIASTDNVALPLVGFPKNLPATGNVLSGANRYIGITGAATINSITSTLEHGSIIVVRALTAVTIVGTGGNIRFPVGWPTTARTFPVGARLMFVYDKGGNNVTLISHTGTTQTMGAVDIVGTAGAGFLGLATQSSTPTATAGTARVFSRVNGSSKTELCVQFPTGAVIVVATEP